jgi:hypothetical protein
MNRKKSASTTPKADAAEPRPRQRHARADDGNAFIPDPGDGPAHSSDELAESLAEEYLSAATSGEGVAEDVRDAMTPEEIGGPFVETRASEEFSSDDDADLDGTPRTQPALREPFPTATRSPQ